METNRTESIRVVVRCRPESRRELEDQRRLILKTNSSRGEVSITIPTNETIKTFSFDQVFNSEASQKTIYDQAAFGLVDSVVQGYNGTIFVYGQTGAGKTHTMQGRFESEELKGIIPRALDHIFNRIESTIDKRFFVRISFIEIHNEEVYDLLSKDPKKKLKVQEKSNYGSYVKDILSLPIENLADAYEKLNTGNQNRSPGLTQMGQVCSKSHAIFSITVESCGTGPDGNALFKMGTLNLVDLAGSETRNRAKNTSIHMDMNKSIVNLENVIYALSDPRPIHIPYKDSKLTKILRDSLGGNARTLLIANIGPADFNYEETLHTLKFAKRLETIKNKPRINENPADFISRDFQEYIEALQASLNLYKEIIERKKEVEEEKDLSRVEREKLLEYLAMKEVEQEHGKISRRPKRAEKYILKGSPAVEFNYQEQEDFERIKNELERKMLLEREHARQLEEQESLWAPKYRSLEGHIDDHNREMRKIFPKIQHVEDELQELQENFDEERASYQQQIYQLNCQLKLKNLVMNHFIPQEAVAETEVRTTWDEQEEDWILSNPQNSLPKPQSSLGFTRPVSEFRREKFSSSLGWRYRSENILDVEMDVPENDLEIFNGMKENHAKEALKILKYPDEEDLNELNRLNIYNEEEEKEMDKHKNKKRIYAPKRTDFDKKKSGESPNKEEEKIATSTSDDHF